MNWLTTLAVFHLMFSFFIYSLCFFFLSLYPVLCFHFFQHAILFLCLILSCNPISPLDLIIQSYLSVWFDLWGLIGIQRRDRNLFIYLFGCIWPTILSCSVYSVAMMSGWVFHHHSDRSEIINVFHRSPELHRVEFN